jgi:hypothetical protein
MQNRLHENYCVIKPHDFISQSTTRLHLDFDLQTLKQQVMQTNAILLQTLTIEQLQQLITSVKNGNS